MAQAINTATTSITASSQAENSRHGIFLLCGGMFIFSFQDVMIKLLSDTYPVHEIVFIRGLVALPLLFVVVHFDSGFGSFKSNHVWQHAVRSILMFGGYFFFYLAAAAIPLSTAIALFFVSPLMITVLSIPLLGEKVGIRRWIGITVGLLGAVIMIRPGFAALEPAMLLPLIAALCYSIAMIMARKMGATGSASVMAFYSAMAFMYFGAFMGVGFSLIDTDPATHPTMAFLLRDWVMPNAIELAMLATIGVISAMGFYLITQAYRLGEATVVAPFEYIYIPIALIHTIVIWGDLPDVFTLVGVSLILGSGIYVLRREGGRGPKPFRGKGLYRGR